MVTRKPRASRMTSFELLWFRILKNSNQIDICAPFKASRAEQVLLDYRNPRTNLGLRYPPNKFRLNYIFKKSKEFKQHQDSNGNNTWTLKEVSE